MSFRTLSATVPNFKTTPFSFSIFPSLTGLFLLPKPLSFLKAEIKSAALSIWQDNRDNGETGRSTHDIVPRVSNKPVRWNREEMMFVTGHGPFPSYLLLFNL
ncbi:hypothetical protein AVEN_142977-1 [Araneus ventricosus]|uniref:Uncharacterized protein n=1 Tax=Araneus ventricosus TaxID=182803 RepID=A0A4Y2PUE7_ARAVE|nr:hypothetical protein AVEN_142977-1 [Araneus ventricosus]